MAQQYYDPMKVGGKKEYDMMKKFELQLTDAKNYFISFIKPRLDRSYKLYIAYGGDRAKEIKKWQANVFVPYTQAAVETLMPRILDARPEFAVQGRNQEDQLKAGKQQKVADYTWEIDDMDSTSEDVVRSSLVFGTGYMQTSWKKDVRTHKFLETKDLATKKTYKWKEREQVFYDAPHCEWVDNYGLWYDWHNIPRQSKQFWFKRLILSGAEIKRRYPYHDKNRIEMAFQKNDSDLTNYGQARFDVKLVHEKIIRGEDHTVSTYGGNNDIYKNVEDPELRMYEVFEWWRPFDDAYSVIVAKVPILKGGVIPQPFDHKEAPFIEVPYLRLPGEFEGVGLPMILESPQIMLNQVKNQRLDAMTLNIHKMWIVNPLANIDKSELVTRPFGIIYSADPAGVKEVAFSDLKQSAYRETDELKSDMRYSSGVDDFSMGTGSNSSSATEVRHLRESTLERVRLFINHIGLAYAQVLRHWMVLWRQFFTEEMYIRITDENGQEVFPLIEKDDLRGEFDYRAAVLPSIAGKNDIDKKQNMDLFQLLSNMPFIDLQKLTTKVIGPWNWDLNSIIKEEQPAPVVPGTPGMPGELAGPGMPGMEAMGAEAGFAPVEMGEEAVPSMGSGEISQDVIQQALSLLGGQEEGGYDEAGNPINLMGEAGRAIPPTVPGIPKQATTNPRGMNRPANGKVNTNIATSGKSSIESNLMNRAQNIQR